MKPHTAAVSLAFIPLHLQFTIDNRQDLWYGCACYLEQTRRYAVPLTPLDSALPRNLAFCTILVQISRLESALTDTSLVTPLECTLTKTPGEGVSPPSSVPCRVSGKSITFKRLQPLCPLSPT